MNCWHCNSDLIWGSDFSFQDCGFEGEGIVSEFTCSNPDCQVTVSVHLRLDQED